MATKRRYFNTSGPNIPDQHYTLMRDELVAEGLDLVENDRYFTISAPRQSGKSTYFHLLADRLRKDGYKVLQMSVESYQGVAESYFLNRIAEQLFEQTGFSIAPQRISELEGAFAKIKEGKLVLIIGEIEGAASAANPGDEGIDFYSGNFSLIKIYTFHNECHFINVTDICTILLL